MRRSVLYSVSQCIQVGCNKAGENITTMQVPMGGYDTCVRRLQTVIDSLFPSPYAMLLSERERVNSVLAPRISTPPD